MIQESKIQSIVNQWNANTDRFLVEVKVSPARIIVFIDKPTGVTLDECAALNRHLAEQLESDGVLEHYDLEVSSPGMDQPFKVLQQYLRRIGREVKVTTTDGKEHQGLLEAADENQVLLKETVTVKEQNKKIKKEIQSTIPFNNIKETKLKLSFKN